MKNTDNLPRTASSLLRRLITWLKGSLRVKRKEAGSIAMNGLFFQNPVFVLMLGLCPALATTISLRNSIGMGVATTVVLICSNLVISLLRNVLPDGIRAISFAVICAAFAAAVDLLMQAFAPDLSEVLGLFIPLIAVNCFILGRTKAFACQNPPVQSVLDGLFTGLGFTGALAVVGAVREILGSGTIWGTPVPVLDSYPVMLLLSPCGGLITLGVLLALVQFIRRPKSPTEREVEQHESC